jgi:AraC-like DNA-binding protein
MKPFVTSHDRKLVESLQESDIYRRYQSAFRTATGMSMFLRLAHTEQIPRSPEISQQNAFCEGVSVGLGCHACAKAHDHLRALERHGVDACTDLCFARMMETAVPVRSGGRTLAWLWTGQVFVDNGHLRSFAETAAILAEAGCSREEVDRLRALWESTPEISAEKYQSVVVLLEAFGKQLSEVANRLIIESRPQEPATVAKARRYIRENLGERLTLEDISRHVGLSPHHFCKVFRRVSGVNLMEYINRSRIEQASQLLLEADARVSEIAFEIGYQSLSQFNRSFRSVTGESPTEYRRRIFKPAGRVA